MKTSRLVVVCGVLLLTVTACQPQQQKKSARKARVSTSARAKMNAQANAKVAEESETQEAPASTEPTSTSTDNILCNIASPETCEAIAVSVSGNSLLGIGRTSAANSGSAKILSTGDVEVQDKSVTANIEISANNKDVKLTLVALSPDDDVKAAYEKNLKFDGLTSLSVKVLKTPLVASEVANLKALIESNNSKVLVIGPTQEVLTASRPTLSLDKDSSKELVAATDMKPEVLLEEALRFYGDVIPLQFVMPHEKSAIKLFTLKVILDNKVLNNSQYGSTAEAAGTNTLKIFLKDRKLLKANSKIKATYSLQ